MIGIALLGLWRLIILVLAVGGVGRVVRVEMANYYATSTTDLHTQEIEKILSWDNSNTKALYWRVKALEKTNPQLATTLARQAYAINPTDSKLLLLLADVTLRQGDGERADGLVAQAVRLDRSDPKLLLTVSSYWDRRGYPANAIAALSDAMTARPGLQATIWPLLLKIAENPTTRELLLPLAQSPPPWWDAFYRYIAERAVSLPTINALLELRYRSKVAISQIERDASVARMIKEKAWAQAYLLWMNGLSAVQMQQVGAVFNGGFELEATNKGFDWYTKPPLGMRITQEGSYGIQGNLGLHVVFEGREFKFAHVYQYLFLDAGEYQLSVLARTGSLQGRGGVSWTVECIDTPDVPLGETDRLLGTNDWRELKIVFVIPKQSCPTQVLRLRSVGKTLYDHRLEGEAWFDQVRILKVRS